MALSRAGLDAVAAGPVAAESLPSGGVYQNTHEKSTNAAGSSKNPPGTSAQRVS